MISTKQRTTLSLIAIAAGPLVTTHQAHAFWGRGWGWGDGCGGCGGWG